MGPGGEGKKIELTALCANSCLKAWDGAVKTSSDLLRAVRSHIVKISLGMVAEKGVWQK